MGDRVSVRRAGIASVQDLGRSGTARLGVSSNGAADAYSARAANALLGNSPANPLLEITAMPFTFSVSAGTTIAVTGAVANVRVGGQPIGQWRATTVPADADIEIRDIRQGLRCYVGVRGRLDVPAFLGSVAPDPALGFGARLRRGDEIPFVPSPRQACMEPELPDGFVATYGDPATLPVCTGPEWDAFAGVRDEILRGAYVVDTRSNHVGIRLNGELPPLSMPGELTSRGVAIGAVELTPSEELIVLHRGRSITAGYPILAVVTTAGLSVAGQLRPGDGVRFRLCSTGEAVEEHRLRQRMLDRVTAAASGRAHKEER
ncbi:hypothetical protein [Nonomuraea sp. B5E05]|uniref:5-oxoprolinase subunit C family protein n=1 Tax=Nonomuraea sp. B5E05 TaxID=3153569 RepID=UPI003261AF8D